MADQLKFISALRANFARILFAGFLSLLLASCHSTRDPSDLTVTIFFDGKATAKVETAASQEFVRLHGPPRHAGAASLASELARALNFRVPFDLKNSADLSRTSAEARHSSSVANVDLVAIRSTLSEFDLDLAPSVFVSVCSPNRAGRVHSNGWRSKHFGSCVVVEKPAGKTLAGGGATYLFGAEVLPAWTASLLVALLLLSFGLILLRLHLSESPAGRRRFGLAALGFFCLLVLVGIRTALVPHELPISTSQVFDQGFRRSFGQIGGAAVVTGCLASVFTLVGLWSKTRTLKTDRERGSTISIDVTSDPPF